MRGEVWNVFKTEHILAVCTRIRNKTVDIPLRTCHIWCQKWDPVDNRRLAEFTEDKNCQYMKPTGKYIGHCLHLLCEYSNYWAKYFIVMVETRSKRTEESGDTDDTSEGSTMTELLKFIMDEKKKRSNVRKYAINNF